MLYFNTYPVFTSAIWAELPVKPSFPPFFCSVST